MEKVFNDDGGQKSAKQRPGKFFVSIDTPVEELRMQDEEGAFVIFEVEPDRFKRLDDETVKSLSKDTKRAYFIAQAIFENKGSIPQSPDEFVVLGQGGPLDGQYNQVELKNPDLVSRYTRKDLVYRRQQRGWKIASPHEVAYAQSRIEGGHFETKDPKTGQTDQVLMVMPRDKYDGLMAQRTSARDEVVKGISQASAEMIQESTGYKTREVE